MKIDDVRRTAYSMPLTNPSFPPGPYRFFNREYFIITYRTDPDALAAVVPAPLEVTEAVVKYEFIRMPDSTGFGDYTETGQVIPVSFKGEEGVYVHSMYLDDEGPIAGGREIWGFPKKLATPRIGHENETLVCSLHQVELARAHFARIVGLRDGRVVFDARREQVSDAMIAALYANSPDALIDATDIADIADIEADGRGHGGSPLGANATTNSARLRPAGRLGRKRQTRLAGSHRLRL